MSKVAANHHRKASQQLVHAAEHHGKAAVYHGRRNDGVNSWAGGGPAQIFHLTTHHGENVEASREGSLCSCRMPQRIRADDALSDLRQGT
jgi:hypothetical protein